MTCVTLDEHLLKEMLSTDIIDFFVSMLSFQHRSIFEFYW